MRGERRSERICNKKTYPYGKNTGNAKRTASLYFTGTGTGKTKGFWGWSPVLLVGGREGTTIREGRNQTMIQLGNDSGEGQKTGKREERSVILVAQLGERVDAVDLDNWRAFGQISCDDNLVVLQLA